MQLTRAQIRRIGATASALMALLYYLIGLGVLNVGGSTTGEMVDLRMFGFSAGSAFLVLAVLLALTDLRWVWAIALLAQFFVYIVYIGASGGRAPAFEIWGITLRLIQLVVIAALVYLTFKAPARPHTEAQR